MIVYDALLMPADINEQLEGQGYLWSDSQLQLVQNGGIWAAEYTFPLFLASAAVATALAPLVAQVCMRLRTCQHK